MKKAYALNILLFSICYIIAAKAGLYFALGNGLATAIWPASGLALFVLLKYGIRMWPALFIGALVANFLQGGSLNAALQIALGNTLEGVVIAHLSITYIKSFTSFTSLRTTLTFVLFVLSGCFISALLGSSATSIYIESTVDYLETILTWWLGDVVSCLIIVPAIYLFNPNSIKELRDKKVISFFIVLGITCYFTFFKSYPSVITTSRAFVYALILFPLWAAVRHSGFTAIVSVFMIFLLAMISTFIGTGPFVQIKIGSSSLIVLQSLMCILELTTLMVSVGIKEKTLIEEQLKDSLAEKELLLSEIHHRVKNNLAIVSGLLYLQSEKITDPDIRKKFNETQGRIKSMALIHEKLYNKESFGKVEFSVYLKELAESIETSYNLGSTPILLNINMDDYFIDIEKAIPCGLIVNEVLTNAYKYAFVGRENGAIEINFSKNPMGYFLSIKDDGVGFDFADNKDKDTLGLTLVGALIDQMDAKMTVIKHNGTIFEFNFN